MEFLLLAGASHKFESRNPKLETNSNGSISKTKNLQFRVWIIDYCFVLRASNFEFEISQQLKIEPIRENNYN